MLEQQGCNLLFQLSAQFDSHVPPCGTADAAPTPESSGISAICLYLGGTKSRQRPPVSNSPALTSTPPPRPCASARDLDSAFRTLICLRVLRFFDSLVPTPSPFGPICDCSISCLPRRSVVVKNSGFPIFLPFVLSCLRVSPLVHPSPRLKLRASRRQLRDSPRLVCRNLARPLRDPTFPRTQNHLAPIGA